MGGRLTSHKSTTPRNPQENLDGSKRPEVSVTVRFRTCESEDEPRKIQGQACFEKTSGSSYALVGSSFWSSFWGKKPRKNKDIFGLETRAKKQMKPGFFFVSSPPPEKKSDVFILFFPGAAFGCIWFHPLMWTVLGLQKVYITSKVGRYVGWIEFSSPENFPHKTGGKYKLDFWV